MMEVAKYRVMECVQRLGTLTTGMFRLSQEGNMN